MTTATVPRFSFYDWGYSYGRRVRDGIIAASEWRNGDGSPIDWRTSDKAFPRGYRDALAAPRPAGRVSMSDLATHLVEFGGELHTRPGWLARNSRGEIVDGFRYARLIPCDSRACRDSQCDACTWHYIGRSFASEDSATALFEILPQLESVQT